MPRGAGAESVPRGAGAGEGGPLCGWGRATRLGSEPGSSLHQGAPLFCLRVLIARDELQPSLNFGDQFSPERPAGRLHTCLSTDRPRGQAPRSGIRP